LQRPAECGKQQASGIKRGRRVISEPIVEMSNVSFAWPGSRRFALTIDTFSLARGERLLLLGPSGSGKSTFLSLLAGIVVPDRGAVSVLGTDLGKLSSSARDRFRAEHFGIIFQQFNLLPYASVLDNTLLPLAFAPTRRARATASETPEADARRLLGKLGLDASVIDGARAASLSVGQQQRVAAARALIGAPELIVADEPTSSLDRGHQLAFLDLLFADLDAADTSLIMVSHDESLASRFSRVARLDEIARIETGAAA
jgi:putative ABC transport system ATP-binding protein